MGLADSLAAASPKHATDKCYLRAWADTLPASEQSALWSAIDNKNITYRELARIISANGYSVSPSTIANHRTGDCRTCERRRPWA